jgi:hypothetical protein
MTKSKGCRNVGISDQLVVISDTQLTRGSSLQNRQARAREYDRIPKRRQDIDRSLSAPTTKTPSTKMSLRPLRTLRPILSQIHYTPYRPYSTPPNNSNEASSSSSKPVIPIPTPSQSEPLPADKKPLELPQLPRPLGVALEPTSSTGTWSEKKERYLDEDRQKAKRKAL